MIIAVDFDGTIADHRFPEIGAPVPGAFEWLLRFQKAGAKLILWTMRSDGQESGEVLTQAEAFCLDNGLAFWGVNKNPEQKKWTQSPKVYAQLYIDDAAFGCPLLPNPEDGARPYVDWDAVGPRVMALIEAVK